MSLWSDLPEFYEETLIEKIMGFISKTIRFMFTLFIYACIAVMVFSPFIFMWAMIWLF